MSEQEVLQKFQAMKGQVNALATKVTELEQEKHEHQLVLDALEKLEPGRRCFRLVGGVLVERTVGEVGPAVTQNKAQLETIIGQMTSQLGEQEGKMRAYQAEHKIQVKGSAARISPDESKGATQGVLA